MEDSKEMANAGSHGMKVELTARTPMTTRAFSELTGKMILQLSQRIQEKEDALIGHVKLFVRTDHGFLKMSVVDLDLGVETVDALGKGKVSKGTMNLMAAVIGVDDEELEELMEHELEVFDDQMDYVITSHCHEDGDHDHYEEERR
jgi:hypothetical protein